MKQNKIFFIFFFLFCLAFVCVVFFLYWIFSPVSTTGMKQAVVVQQGETITSIAKKLQTKNILRSNLSLRILSKFWFEKSQVHPGSYMLSSAMSPYQIFQTLESEPQDVWVTLPEGLRSEEIAAIFSTKLGNTYFHAQEFLLLAKPVEGKLFPDTYLFSKESDAAKVFSTLTATFEARYNKATYGKQVKLSKNDVITLASLIERESVGKEDAAMVAGVLVNRLSLGMPLQVDASLQYIVGIDAETGKFWNPPQSEEKMKKSPYNTYLHPGLPPGPICNPGLASLQAAISPADHRYLYYLHGRDGTAHFAQTYDEHRKNIEMYLR